MRIGPQRLHGKSECQLRLVWLADSNSGFEYELREVAKDDVEEAIIAANTDDTVDGIIIYYPIFGHRQDQYLREVVAVGKDVEGLGHQHVFNLYQNIRFLDEDKTQKSVLPCTPLAVVKILEYLNIYNMILRYGNRLHGRTITVINRSEVVGRPLAALLANDGANVYSVDISNVQQFHRGEGLRKRRHTVSDVEGWSLDDCLPLSDVVISGVPGNDFKVPVKKLKEGAVCINISSEKVSLIADQFKLIVAEFQSRGQAESFDICSSCRQSHHHCTTAKLTGKYHALRDTFDHP
jgi:methylenetetrahydrofolate dehydrogenase (NAD+)